MIVTIFVCAVCWDCSGSLYPQLLSHCHQIVNLGGLELLQRIYENRRHSIKVKRSIARILGNIAVCPSLRDNIVQAGIEH